MSKRQERIVRIAGRAVLLLPLLAVLFLLFLDPSQDILGGVIKPVVVWLLGILGVQSQDLGHAIQVGAMEVPWSRDCAGFNHLLLLLALVIWMRRHQLWRWETLTIVACAIPAAFVANIARILTIIGYRTVSYPNIESAELHYLIGFLWLLPFAVILLPKQRRSGYRTWVELAHAVVVVSLLAPLLGTGENLAMAAAAVILLARGDVPHVWSQRRIIALVGWMLIGIGITIVRMESFWLPWILVSPLTAQPSWAKEPRTIALLAVAHPLFDLLPGGTWISWGVVGWSAWVDFLKKPNAQSSIEDSGGTNRWLAGKPIRMAVIAASLLMLSAPFIANLVNNGDLVLPSPPQDAVKYPIPGEGMELRMPAQPDTLGILWYTPDSNDRHHSLPVCMKYRGVHLKKVAGLPATWTEGKHWYREFFLQDEDLISSHLDYVLATLGITASPGIHLVFVARQSDMDVDTFTNLTETFASRIYESVVHESKEIASVK